MLVVSKVTGGGTGAGRYSGGLPPEQTKGECLQAATQRGGAAVVSGRSHRVEAVI